MPIRSAIEIIRNSHYCIAFTGAGISVESGIPPFRGDSGLWSKYDPIVLDINYFKNNPKESWAVIKEIFYDFFGKAKPNPAHDGLAKMEAKGILKSVITQNIDNLHQEAGSKAVWEFHGNSHSLECTGCGRKYAIHQLSFDVLPVLCPECKQLIKPDFVFFGEGIPPLAYQMSMEEASKADCVIVIGTTGEIMPASYIPHLAKEGGAKVIEINPEESRFTNSITDVYINEKASSAMKKIVDELKLQE
ncbi:MAG: NAD-dependent deacylase [Chlorobi bacterium]|nr:NAD-dependent deacylase [Chlorobiota bacterium]